MRFTLPILLSLTLAAMPAWSQVPNRPAAPPPFVPPLNSPEVHPDRSVTFRFRDPNAKEVFVSRDGAPRLAMARDDQEGVWTVTTAPLEPDFYGYSFVADGVSLSDPSDPLVKPSVFGFQSMVHVPGPDTIPWEWNDVPHGVVHHHVYRSAAIGAPEDYYVYTPPGYDPRSRRLYPVLYLLHGFSDDASAWTAVGQAHLILDNLIAQGKAAPMLMVMPLGYGAPDMITQFKRLGFGGFRDPSLLQRNNDNFTTALLTEMIPQVEKTYRVAKDPDSRAITGLSMGGGESLSTGLNHLDRFAWIGSFSGAIVLLDPDLRKAFPSLNANDSSRIRLLWIACGTDDMLLEPNRKLEQWLAGNHVAYTAVETPGAHTWMVWRRNLAAFVPLLFQPKSVGGTG